MWNTTLKLFLQNFLLHVTTALCEQNPLIPPMYRENVVGHIVTVHASVGVFSRDFQHKLRRANYVSPKNYLDFINTYLRLLDEKDKFIMNQVTLNGWICLHGV